MDFHFANLPDDFTHLLKVNMQSSGKHFSDLQSYIVERKGLYLLFRQIFKDIDNSGNVEKVLKSAGWHGIRDRLCCLYIENLINGEYPSSVQTGNCYGILGFEDILKPYSIGGYSRAFLLGFYLKMSSIEQNLLGKSTGAINFNIHEVVEILSISSARTVKIDLLVILIKHLIDFFGKDQLKEHIGQGLKYKDLYERLNLEQKSLMVNNFLSYGSSINEKEIFIMEHIG
ncbi:hypothetical protein BIY24_06690 [Halobacteriovorax marinus]|uniref:Uncharacterized protein n=1 Tax=Halobacteriovorax marinus (strain ATCC BAA-682 / DSM 15412 / SJ) TaxID=862908 RepID=E1X050_HALMS|nr:hypothetical protein [Halobacteriovorax marinus]ATH07640.1 hypothetical protein BIY24_06690 [Halobacteriovorax marinus]CBW26277.1 hypothetical protein BMS_1414 [Halobacteriovorax marinus SJ]